VIRALTFGRYADDNFGGLERYVFELARSLEREVRYTNIVAQRGGAPDLAMVGETVYARPWVSLAGTPVCPTMPWHALARHRRAPFDLVHLQFPADPMAHLATALLPHGVKRIITWHSDIVRQQKLLALYRPFLDRLVRSADAIIAATPAHISSSRQLDAVQDRARLHVVPFGFDLSRLRERPPLADELRRRYGARFLVFALGRHVYYKGFEFLIRALAQMPEANLMLGGQGPLTEELGNVARQAGVADRVHFVGRIAEADLPAYYHACDVFCLSSVEPAEGFGIVQIEAMAAGKPVVCCELHNGVTWVNQDGVTGLVVPPADPAALAGALKRLMHEPALRAQLGEQGRRRAFSVFTVEAMARGTLEVYRAVLKGDS
jgi:glycosyltransferase involved in cell wall biosynthesis